ncbi:MAG: GIY-YIG nuclease family protein [Phyllobacteriaceae bacterium]|nr:GIY-YIG nuclease family protein [Phyllobacteriaceae bacterium]
MAWVYIMANRKFGAIYVGATTNLLRRVWQHKNDLLPGFTRQHQCRLLVYYEEQANMYWALQRERNIKHWVRDWKDALIERDNPEWDDLYFGIASG